jgi:hypothetical protein
MTTRTVTMSHSELDRFGIITKIRERRLTQVEAARILDLGVRQVQRLCAAVGRDGADGLVSRKRGRPSSRRLSDDFRREILTLYLVELERSYLPEYSTDEEGREIGAKGARRFDRFEQWLARQLVEPDNLYQRTHSSVEISGDE